MNGELALAVPVGMPIADRLEALFDAHEDRLYRLARRLVQRPEDARDLVQETFLRAASSLKHVPEGFSREEAWLVRVLLNIQRDRWRRMAVRERVDLPAGGASPSDPETALITKRAVWSALDCLHPKRRAVVVMHELEGIPLARIASLLGIGQVTVQWHLSMGRRELRRLLQPLVGDIR
jgi:RNA polymerase sigma-70 factor (ECF subfamily)